MPYTGERDSVRSWRKNLRNINRTNGYPSAGFF